MPFSLKFKARSLVIIITADGNMFDTDSFLGPSTWKINYPICSDSSQSPVNIVTADTVHDAQLGAFTFSGYDTLPAGAQYKLEKKSHAGKEPTVCGIRERSCRKPVFYGLLQFLPPANDVWGQIIFSQACVIPSVQWGGGGLGSRPPPSPSDTTGYDQ